MNWLLNTAVGLSFIQMSNAQVKIPASNGNPTNRKGIPCGICVPQGWSLITGTPDISTSKIVAGNDTSGGGEQWTNQPLALPPNGHTNWITIRDVGSKSGEEAIQTNMTNLVVGRDYEVVIYSMTAIANNGSTKYSPTYIDKFDFQVGTYPRVNVTQINKDIDGAWGTNRLVFTAQSSSMPLKFYPGYNASTDSFESVNISVTLNAINTLPVGQNFMEEGVKNQLKTLDVGSKAIEYDSGQSIQLNTIDLDLDTPGIQNVYVDATGKWEANSSGFVTFTPANGFEGQASIKYTIQDNYSLNGVPSPGTSLPKSLRINIPPCTITIQGSDFAVEGGEEKTFTMPATDYGFQFDIYELDNSFQLNINGVDLANEEIDFQANSGGSKLNAEFLDGLRHGMAGTERIFVLKGDKDSPIVRVKIDPKGNVTLLARKTNADKTLYEMRLFGKTASNPNVDAAFNVINWHTDQPNTVIASQKVVGATSMKGYGSGLKIVECPCYRIPKLGTPTGTTNVGITTNTTINSNWPTNIPNAALVLDSKSKGMVISRINNVLEDIKAPIEGMIAYDETDKCVKLYNGDNWKCLNNACD
ncbi:Ig-like domain-containing protein [Empedobacter brevis]|uniref:Ig-like domain-containing protein n=1 Tax=Empedobacter brevis TaxID=247 RepID=UPI0039AF3E22